MKGTCVLWYLFDSSISLEYFHTQSMRLEIILGVKVDKEQILKTLKCLVDGLGSKNNWQKFIEATLLLNLMSLGPFPGLRITWNRNEEKEKKSGKGKKNGKNYSTIFAFFLLWHVLMENPSWWIPWMERDVAPKHLISDKNTVSVAKVHFVCGLLLLH